MNTNTSLTNPTVAATLTDEEWVALHVPRFAAAKGAYAVYETFLKDVLKEACARLAPYAVVEGRPKGIPSFAEKILRKRKDYQDPKDPLPPDPLVRITDLCGERVICQTSEQVHAVCRFIEEAFVIDWPNSEDVSQRLKPAEFGYRSVHYIVQVDPKRLKQAGVHTPVPKALLGFSPEVLGEHAAHIPLKAEIQVRTFLEHASSNLGHDNIYKTELKVPDRIKRQYAALAAVLEGADGQIGRVLAAMDDFKSNFGAWHDRKEVEKEIKYSGVLLGLPEEHLPLADKIPVAVRAARLALSIGNHTQAIEILQPFQDQSHAGVLRVLGQALVEQHWHEPHHEDFAQGQEYLKKASGLAPGDAETLCLRAECAAHENDDVEARRLFTQAVEADGTEPLTLVRYLEFEAAHQSSDIPLRLASPMIRAAITRCQRQIEARVNLPAAWSALAVFHLFLGKPFEALHGLAQVVQLCSGPVQEANAPAQATHPCAAGRALLRLRDTTRRLKGICDRLPGFDWFDRFVLLALAIRLDDREAHKKLVTLASWKTGEPHFHIDQKTVILSGGCSEQVQPFMKTFGTQIQRACEGLAFVLISGGTRSGISGVAGDLAGQSAGRIQAFGYLPSYLPVGVKEDTKNFPHPFSSPGTDFTPLEPLQAWTDLIAAGVAPASIKLICYAPGDIARSECAMALALGARVGLVQDRSLPKDWQFDTTPWADASNLLALPLDAMTLRAYLLIEFKPLNNTDRARLEPAARMAHEEYVKSAKPKEPSLQDWKDLDEGLKLSNFCQVAYWEETLRTYHLGVRPLTPEDLNHELLVMEQVLPKVGDKDPVLELAELEHGRWNVERLAFGWQYSPEKDIAKKLSPWLIPWDKVPPEIQRIDIEAIHGLPKKLREAGLELYKL